MKRNIMWISLPLFALLMQPLLQTATAAVILPANSAWQASLSNSSDEMQRHAVLDLATTWSDASVRLFNDAHSHLFPPAIPDELANQWVSSGIFSEASLASEFDRLAQTFEDVHDPTVLRRSVPASFSAAQLSEPATLALLGLALLCLGLYSIRRNT